MMLRQSAPRYQCIRSVLGRLCLDHPRLGQRLVLLRAEDTAWMTRLPFCRLCDRVTMAAMSFSPGARRIP